MELLRQIGIDCRTIAVEVDESRRPGESPARYVERLAIDKARQGRALAGRADIPILGADTAVVIDDEILGKPDDRAAGLAMLRRLAGRAHRVLTGVAVVCDARVAVRTSMSEVRFRQLGDGECARYWASGEPRDKAGGYAVQGLAAAFVSELRGSYSGVVGLPLCETAELLAEFGIYVLGDG